MEIPQEDENKIIDEIIEINDIFLHKYNLYQQFLVISIDPKIMYNINEMDLKNIPEPLNLPKVISKYPNINLPYLNIPDTIIASHCFPQGIISAIVDYEEKDLEQKEKKTENFIFSLENMCPELQISSLKTNKVYYTCLLFYENIDNYRNCINQRKNDNTDNNNIRNNRLLIPKVICLSSFNPFYEQTKYILQKIKNYVDNYNYNHKSLDNINIYPIEKIIEGLIFSLPNLPRGNNSISLSTDTFSFEINDIDEKKNDKNKDLDIKNIIFKETPPNKNPRIMVNYSILMLYFRIEEIFEVIKYIILEEPILFFCEDKEILTNIIASFISLIYPLQYPYPVITILPEQNFSLITLFEHFIFGINTKYSEDYLNKKIILDGVKFIRIIRLDKRFNNIINFEENDKLEYSIFTSLKADENKPLIKIDEDEHEGYSFKKEKEKDDDINAKKNISLPRHYFEKCVRRLEKDVAEKIKEVQSKSKNKKINNINKEKENIFNIVITENFLYFFTCILLKYQEYCVKFGTKIYEDRDKEGNIIEKEFGERNYKLDEKYYMGNIQLNDIFDSKEFIDSIPSLDRAFYSIFFKTKIFYNFIYKKIFPESNQDKLDVLYFDELINKKISRESRMQKIETKFLEYDYDSNINEIKIGSLKRKINSNLNNFLQKHENRAKALNYFQFIYSNFDEEDSSIDEESIPDSEKKDQIFFYYYVFPILLNDGIFYNENGDIKNKKKFYNSEFFQECQKSDKLYNKFEEESNLIIEDDEINKNYKIYNYSLNPTSVFHMKNEYMIKMLWLRYFSKTFHIIPISKKKYYFDVMNIFMKKNKKIIDERTILMIFNCINEYGDRNMNQDYFTNLKNKNYTSYLCLRETTKPENNFIKYIINQDNLNTINNNTNNINNNINANNINNNINQKNTENISPTQNQHRTIIFEEKKLMTFKVNYFCIGQNEELNLYQNSNSNINNDNIEDNNICNQPFMEKISELYSDSDEYIQCKCNKCFKDQRLSISCEYNDEDNDKYIIDFELLSPMALLTQKWFQNNSKLDPSYISEEHLECYLSAIFYFYEQNLPCEFLMYNNINNENTKELKEIRNMCYSNINSEEFYDKKDIDKIIIIENTKKEKMDENNKIDESGEEIKEIKENKKYSENNLEKNLKSCFKGNKKGTKNVEFKLSFKP